MSRGGYLSMRIGEEKINFDIDSNITTTLNIQILWIIYVLLAKCTSHPSFRCPPGYPNYVDSDCSGFCYTVGECYSDSSSAEISPPYFKGTNGQCTPCSQVCDATCDLADCSDEDSCCYGKNRVAY